jgi:nucleoside-diphosphate-sugar epimerase
MSQERIFITGSTGFIGSHVIDVALKAGYRVRLSVRKDTQITLLKSIFPTGKLEFVIVPDISQRDAFQGLLDDVDYIFHLASPMPGKGQDIQKDYVEPAVNGTESILLAASRYPRVKKVVIMSSLLSIIPMGAIQKPGIFISGKVTNCNLASPLSKSSKLKHRRDRFFRPYRRH